MTSSTRFLPAILLMLVLLANAAFAQFPTAPQNAFDKKKITLEFTQSQRHLEYGLDLRKQGMPTQSAAEIVLAAELGRGRNPGATQVMYIMRQYDASFWKKYGTRPSKGKIEQYDKKARALLLADQKDSLALANWAATHQFEQEGEKIYVELLLERDDPLEFDNKGQIVLPAGTIPAAASKKLRESAITINGKLYVRDEVLARLPELKEVFEVASDELRVRTTTTLEEAVEIHAMCMQLLPALAEDLGATSQRRLALFLFGTRVDYEKTLDALDLGGHKLVSGVAMPSPLIAMVCAEDLEPAIVRGVCLHETTHLFFYSVTHSVFPAWYSEGFADTYGGTGTFEWDGAKLTLGGMIDPTRLDALEVDGALLPLEDMLVADQLVQWQKSKDAGLAFAAQSWAFLRYLRTGAGALYSARLDEWEARCIGQVLGYEAGARIPTKRGPASDLFHELFAKDLPKLEAGFRLWLREQ